MALDPKEEQKLIGRAGMRASWFIIFFVTMSSILVGFLLVSVVLVVKPTGSVAFAVIAVGLLAKIAILVIAGQWLLFRGLFKPRQGYQLVPDVTMYSFSKEKWLWAAYAFGVSLAVGAVTAVLQTGLHLKGNSTIGPLIGCLVATQMIAKRIVKNGKAHIELN